MIYLSKITHFIRPSCNMISSSVYMIRKSEVNDTCIVTVLEYHAGSLDTSSVIGRQSDN